MIVNVNKWNQVFIRNKELDELFFDKYGNDRKVYKKNCVEFLVELGEFINESKCFKYWSIKKPNIDKTLEELADVFTMLMYFYNELNIDIPNNIEIVENDLFEIINDTFNLGTNLLDNLNEKLLNNIFNNLYNIAIKLNINDDMIIEAISKKHIIIEERFSIEY